MICEKISYILIYKNATNRLVLSYWKDFACSTVSYAPSISLPYLTNNYTLLLFSRLNKISIKTAFAVQKSIANE
jgi:hypothetical protein